MRCQVFVFSVLDDSDHRYLPRQGVSDFASLIVLVSKALPMLANTAITRAREIYVKRSLRPWLLYNQLYLNNQVLVCTRQEF